MSAVAAIVVLLGGLRPDACEAALRKIQESKLQQDAWTARHHVDCPLCAGGSSCREGFMKAETARRDLEEWKRVHQAACAACQASKCGAAETALGRALDEARTRHKEKCRRCEFDPKRCDGWRAAVDEVSARMREWRLDHPAHCEKCVPACDDWKRRTEELAGREADAAKKHRDRCGDCRVAPATCARAALIPQEHARERLALWRKHLDACPCTRPARRETAVSR